MVTSKKTEQQIGTITWQLTPWQMNGDAGWKQSPVITAEGMKPFFADHPKDYIQKLKEMHADSMFARGQFHMYIGQFKDALEQSWEIK